MAKPTLEELRNEYNSLLQTCEIRRNKLTEVQNICDTILANKARYETIATASGVGKFVSDGVFDPNAVSKQCGAAVILRRLLEMNAIEFDEVKQPELKDDPGIVFSNKKSSDPAMVERVKNFQRMLNTQPRHLPDSRRCAWRAHQRRRPSGLRSPTERRSARQVTS